MQKDDKQRPAQEPRSAPDQELSEAFRALLGLAATPGEASTARPVDPAAQVPPQSSDPWSALLQVRGMETIDLQKIRLRELYPAASDEDVEQALNMIREVGDQPTPPEKRPGQM